MLRCQHTCLGRTRVKQILKLSCPWGTPCEFQQEKKKFLNKFLSLLKRIQSLAENKEVESATLSSFSIALPHPTRRGREARGWGREGRSGLILAGQGVRRGGQAPPPPIPHLSGEQEKRRRRESEGKHPRALPPVSPWEEQGGRQGKKGRWGEWRGWGAAAQGLTAVASPEGRERAQPPRVWKVRTGGGKRPSLLPMLGAPAGRSRRLLLLLLLLLWWLARPLPRLEAGPALRASPSWAQAGRRVASIRPRRSPTSLFSAAREAEAKAATAPHPWPPQEPRRREGPTPPARPRFSHPGRSRSGEGPTGLPRPSAPTPSARPASEPAPRLFLSTRS